MRKRLLLSMFFCACALYVAAETIVLRTGAQVRGQIVFQNEEVIVVRDETTGARSQYPRADVAHILTEENAGEAQTTEVAENESIKTSKKASILIELSGGVSVIPGKAVGGAVAADLLVGSHHIADKHIFLGGGLGYHGLYVGAEKYNFLPIQAALRVPFAEMKHVPVFGLSIGYGIALSKDYVGGIYAGLDLGYRCQLNPKTAISVVAFAQFQQATLTVTDIIDDEPFVYSSGRNLLASGLKLAFYF